MVQDLAVALALKVEVRVVCEVEERVVVGYGEILEAQVALRQGVANGQVEGTGIASFAVLAQIVQRNTIFDPFRLPDDISGPAESTVQGIRAVVQRKVLGVCVEGEGAVGYAITISPDQRSKERVLLAVEVADVPPRDCRIQGPRRQRCRACLEPSAKPQLRRRS